MNLNTQYKTLLDNNGVNTPLRLAHFFAQIDHESGLKPIAENMNYAATALVKLFGKHRITQEQANQFGRTATQRANQQAIADIVYGGEWGKKNLGNIALGDGWRFRGRGFIQITGRANYSQLSKDTKIDYINKPELLETEADSMISALWFWNKANLNTLADKDDVNAITRRINGGFNGLPHRKQLLEKYKKLFNVS